MLNKIQNQRSSEEIRTRIPWILWFIWKARNDMVFELKEISPMEILHSATLEAASKSLAYVVSAVTEENESPLVVEHRTIPSRPFCRFDASWKDTDTRYVEGSVIVNEDGNIIFGSFSSNRVLSLLHAEILTSSQLWLNGF